MVGLYEFSSNLADSIVIMFEMNRICRRLALKRVQVDECLLGLINSLVTSFWWPKKSLLNIYRVSE